MLLRFWRSNFALPLIFLLWPFFYFYPYLLPFYGHYRGIGNDFLFLYESYKAYLLDKLSHGHFPLWSPSEGGGFPFYSNPFAQVFYPLNLLLVVFYVTAGGYTPLDHQWFTVFGISLFALGLYLWLQRLISNRRALIFAIGVMSVSFRMSELLRFPNAIHTAAWYPWILFGITEVFCSRTRKRTIKYGAILFVIFLFFLTGGYPYYIYYSQFFLIPYTLLLVICGAPNAPLGVVEIKNNVRSLSIVGCSGLGALLLCSPYLYKMSQLLKATTDRDGSNFAYSTEYQFNIDDTVGSLVYPPLAQTEGVYYFGMFGIFLIALYLLGGERRAWRSSSVRWHKIFIVSWFVLISYITYQKESFLFIFLWRHMPGFSSLRVWGRMNVIFVPFFAWLLAIAYSSFERMLTSVDKSWMYSARRWIIVVTFCVTSFIIIGEQFHFYRTGAHDPYWLWFPWNLNKAIYFPIAGVIAFFVVVALLVMSFFKPLRASWQLTMVLILAITLSIADIRPVGTSLWLTERTVEQHRRFNIDAMNTKSFKVRRRNDYSQLVSLSSEFNVGIVPNWFYKRFVDFYLRESKQTLDRDYLLGMLDGNKIFFSQENNYQNIRFFLDDAKRYPNVAKVSSYDGDRLLVDVQAPMDGYLNFIDNWDPDWEANIDGNQVNIMLLAGTFKSLRVPAGAHHVEFCYVPKLQRW